MDSNTDNTDRYSEETVGSMHSTTSTGMNATAVLIASCIDSVAKDIEEEVEGVSETVEQVQSQEYEEQLLEVKHRRRMESSGADMDGTGVINHNSNDVTKIVYITAIYGGYEQSCKSYIPQTVPADFICFTDNGNIESNGWEVDTTPYHFTHPSPLDDVTDVRDMKDPEHSLGGLNSSGTSSPRSVHSSYNITSTRVINSLTHTPHPFHIAKYYKQAFNYIPRLKVYDVVVWLDGNVNLIDENCTDKLLTLLDNDMHYVVAFDVQIRDNLVSNEAFNSVNLGRYCNTFSAEHVQPYQNITQQYEDYLDDGFVDGRGVFITSFIAFKMHADGNSNIHPRKDLMLHDGSHAFLNTWYNETLIHTVQDQVS